MQKFMIGLALALAALPAWAQTGEEWMWLCQGANPDTKIDGCTALIQSEHESKANQALAYYNRGNAYKNKELFDLAIADYAKVIALKPDFAIPYNSRGFAYEGKGFHDQAITDFTKAIALKPDFAYAYVNRGYSYEIMGLHDQAIADYTKAIELKPDFALAYENRGT